MATETIPTVVTDEAVTLAKEYGVERALEAILEQGRLTVRGLQALEVEAEPVCDMGDPLVVIRAEVDPAFEDDPSHAAWWNWRLETFGVLVGALFVVTIVPHRD